MSAPAGPFSIGSDHWPGVAKLLEEMGEAAQVLGKLIAAGGDPNHWDGTNLVDRMVEELGDLSAAIEFVITTNGLDADAIDARAAQKLAVFRHWQDTQGGYGEWKRVANLRVMDPAEQARILADLAQRAVLVTAGEDRPMVVSPREYLILESARPGEWDAAVLEAGLSPFARSTLSVVVEVP